MPTPQPAAPTSTTHQHEPFPRPRHRGPRRPRVRASCNNCAALKIRCGQERPSCLRCQTKELECTFSVSRRSGRPSQAVQDARRCSATTTSATESKSDTSHHLHTFDDALYPLAQCVHSTTLESGSEHDVSIEEWMMDIPAIPTSAPNGSSVAAEAGEELVRGDCMQLLMRCTLDLHACQPSCQSTAADANNTPLTDSAGPYRTVDSILLRNLEAVKLLESTLACPCSLDYSILELGYLVASKIISWYELVLGTAGDALHKVISVPVSVGNYQLDSEHILGHMILEDLRRHYIPTLVKLSAASAGLSWQGVALRKRVEGVITAASRVSFSRNDDLVAAIPLR